MKKKALLIAVAVVVIWRIATSVLLFALGQYLDVYPIALTPDHRVLYDALKSSGFFNRYFLLPWFRWDTFHYITIAMHGYITQGHTVWPPLFPALIAAFSATGLHPLAASLVVSTLASVAVFYHLYLLVEEEWPGSGKMTLFYLIMFPVAFYLIAGYSESVFLALSLYCFRQARKGRLLSAGLLALLATLTRQMGMLLAVPIFIESLRTSGFTFKQFSVRKVTAAAGYALLPFAGFVLFSLYVHYALGYGFLWDSIELHGRRFLVAPGWSIFMTLGDIISGRNILNPFAMGMDALLSLAACILLIQGVIYRREFPFSFLAYYIVNLLVIIMFMMENKPLGSASRYLLVLFPIYIWQARLWKSQWARITWFIFALIGTALMLGGFFAWLWIE